MTGKGYFILGCKLFGVYCLFESIPALLAIISTFVHVPMEHAADIDKIYTASVITIRILPIIYISVGIYLIRGAGPLYRFAYPSPSDSGMAKDSEDTFTLFVKMLGIFLIICYVPDLLRNFSSYLAYADSRAFKIFSFMQNEQNTYLNAASSIWGVAFGFYLLKGGKFIVKLSLENILRHEDNTAADYH